MNNNICFDPLRFKTPKGTVVKGTKVNFKIQVSEEIKPNFVYLMVKEDAETDYFYHEMHQVNGGYETDVIFKDFGHFWYNFKFVFDGYNMFVSRTFDNRSYYSNEKGEDFLQLVTEKEYKLDGAIEGGIIYQILVDRFAKSGKVKCREPLILRDDWGGALHKNTTDPLVINREVFGGNFNGVTSKLNYLKELGVTVIYFNPISLASSNHKYDTADYMKLDDMYGSDENFKNLVNKAKELGIKVIVDGVYNHTGSDSVYFNKYKRFNSVGAYNSQKSPYYDWFSFIDYPDVYEAWWGIDTLPKVRRDAKEFHELIAGKNGVIAKYLNMGVFGVRLDVVDEISDEFTKLISDRVKTYGENRIVMGEVWEDAATKISYSERRKYFTRNELSSVMNYPIKESIISYVKTQNPKDFESTIRMLLNNYPKPVQDNLMNFLGTHDTGRFYNELIDASNGDREIAFKLLKIATTLMFTVIGVPSIFYGDEYGMENNDGSSRGCFDWDNYKNEIFDWYMKLSKVRKLKILEHGDMNILFAKNGKIVFERISENEKLVVCTNVSDDSLEVNLNGKFASFFTGEEKNHFDLNKYDFDVLIEKM